MHEYLALLSARAQAPVRAFLDFFIGDMAGATRPAEVAMCSPAW